MLNKNFFHLFLGFLAILASSFAVLMAVNIYESEIIGDKGAPANSQAVINE